MGNFESSTEKNIIESKDCYEYRGTIFRIATLQNKPANIYFKGNISRCFWLPIDKILPLNAKIGAYVSIIYQEIEVKTY